MKLLIFSAKIKQEDGRKNGTRLDIYKTFDYHVSCKRSDCSSKIRVILGRPLTLFFSSKENSSWADKVEPVLLC